MKHVLHLDENTSPATWAIFVCLGLALWFGIYHQLHPVAHWLTAFLPISSDGALYKAIAFFLYDTPKVLMLLTLVVFIMGVVRSYFSVERTRKLLAGRREGIGNIAAATLGIFTPFCSCSAIPLFVGFVSAGVPLGVTFSFLIAAPMVNEIALGLLFALLGWKVALTYLGLGLGLAITAGWIIGRLKLENWLEDWVKDLRTEITDLPPEQITFSQRMEAGFESVKDIVGKVWLWVIVGIALGAFIHGYVPAAMLAKIMGNDTWWSVPAAVILGIPMYSSAAGMVPIIEALIGKGAALGTVLAFMMSVIALSAPEMIILRKVLTVRLIAVFISVVGLGILLVGFIFNMLFS